MMVDNKYSMFTKIQRPHTLLISAYTNTRPMIARSCPALLCVFLLKYCTYNDRSIKLQNLRWWETNTRYAQRFRSRILLLYRPIRTHCRGYYGFVLCCSAFFLKNCRPNLIREPYKKQKPRMEFGLIPLSHVP